MGQQNNSYRS